jgi:hypothetical protein
MIIGRITFWIAKFDSCANANFGSAKSGIRDQESIKDEGMKI